MKPSYFLFAVMVFSACRNQVPEPVETAPQTPSASQRTALQVGKVIDSLPVSFNEQHSYALYKPSSGPVGAGSRALIFFDPHGNGAFPLTLYQELAEEYRCVLIGSNDSRNGLDFEQTFAIARELVDEAEQKLGLDASNITLCGFSGGAKVALYSGNRLPEITKVIYCGGALNIPLQNNIKILGFAGRLDPNYTDLVQYEWYMRNRPVEHYFVEWSGDHRFPDAAVFRDGFRFATGQPIDLTGKGITITPAEVEQEQTLKDFYMQALESKDTGWWKEQVSRLHGSEAAINHRLLDFMSLVCYSLANQALQQNDRQKLEKILAIYRIVDPESKGPDELAAKLNRKDN